MHKEIITTLLIFALYQIRASAVFTDRPYVPYTHANFSPGIDRKICHSITLILIRNTTRLSSSPLQASQHIGLISR